MSQENEEIEARSLFIERGDHRLHLRRLRSCGHAGGPAVLMVHGAVENGRVFSLRSGGGLGPFLARRGFDVFIADLRGRGRSTPPIDRRARHGQTESIVEEIPAFLGEISRRRPRAPQCWIAHSWGGVLLAAHLARQPPGGAPPAAIVCFGSKRSVRVWNAARLLWIELSWKRAARLAIACWGYLPGRKLRIGSDSETAKSHRQSVEWVEPGPWVDSDDGFDYAAALARRRWPPIWHIAAAADACLGHPRDVADFVRECGLEPAEVLAVLSRANGNLRDYDHITMLTDPRCDEDHFPAVADWLAAQVKRWRG